MRKRILLFLFVSLLILGGCSKEVDFEAEIHKGMNEQWTIGIPTYFAKDSEEKVEDFLMTTYIDEEGRKLTISEITDKKTVIDEKFFINEIGEDSYFHADENIVLDIKDIGKAYGVVGDDSTTNSHFIYYKVRVDDNVISFVVFKKDSFSIEEKDEIKTIISTIKRL